MKIPFEDRRMSMNKRWTDIRKMHEFRFRELSDLIENCNELERTELCELKQIIDKKLTLFNA
ncbi:MAG TPA: hypothetical protein VK885_00800 [Desulfotignum sp.]|jgi:hypothetical protein|nr:hypothetical protein [Desulfotignum sp.]